MAHGYYANDRDRAPRFGAFNEGTRMQTADPQVVVGLDVGGTSTNATVLDGSGRFLVDRLDAAIGIQIGQPIGRLIVHKGIHTEGGTGDSLVRGVITRLSAHALSIQPGGRVEAVEVG